jgi:hypothetical protein
MNPSAIIVEVIMLVCTLLDKSRDFALYKFELINPLHIVEIMEFRGWKLKKSK